MAGNSGSSNLNPSHLGDLTGYYTQGDAAQERGRGAGCAHSASAAWSVAGMQARTDALDNVSFL